MQGSPGSSAGEGSAGARPPPVDRGLSFWLLAALLGAAAPPLAGLVGATATFVLTLLYHLLASDGRPKEFAEFSWMLWGMGFVYALPLSPAGALCVPLAYRRASRPQGGGRRMFAVLGAFYGFCVPIVVGGIISVAAFNPAPVLIGLIFGAFGALFAPFTAWVLWPVLWRNDERGGWAEAAAPAPRKG